MNVDEIKDVVESNKVYVATAGKDASPHLIVVDGVKVVEGKIVFTDNYMERTISNILENGKIELLVYAKGWKGFLIEGNAEYHDSGKWQDFVKGLKENEPHPGKGAVVVIPLKITGKK